MKRARYQFGRLELKQRKTGPPVWVFRFYERNSEGKKIDRSILVGSELKYPTESRAWDGVRSKGLLQLANPDHPGRNTTSVGMLLGRYLAEELPERYSTARSYRSYIKKWIEPKWKEYELGEVRPMAVEQWLGSLPLAPKSRRHVRGILRVAFQAAFRWDMIARNPIELVRVKGGTKRIGTPRVLSPEEFSKLMRELKQPYRTMVLIAGSLGLRASEIVGLQWGDFEWEHLSLTVHRGCVDGQLDDVKTEDSHRPLPLDPDVATEILRWKEESLYPNKGPEDFVFPNLNTGKPMWQESILQGHIKPAAERAALGSIGWHTFRHSYRAWLKRTEASIEVQRELMRHAQIQTTLDVYGKEDEISDRHREANSKVVKLILGKGDGE